MPTENPQPPKGPMALSPKIPASHQSGSVMFARIVGILCVAGGFILGIHGLDQPDSPMLSTALGMIVTGVVAQVFALTRSWYLYSQRKT